MEHYPSPTAGALQILRMLDKRPDEHSQTCLERVNRALDRIHGRLDSSIRLQDLARAAHLSPFHFHRVFQAIVGETPAEYVRRVRLDKALRTMAAHYRPKLTEVALACGFSSSADFSRAFKQRFGVPPSAFDIDAWRRAHAAELAATTPQRIGVPTSRQDSDGFVVQLRDIPARTVNYIRVSRPYVGDRVRRAAERLIHWAEREGVADRSWIGYQWEHPEITALKDCTYCIAVEADRPPQGEIGRHSFPAMTVAEIALRGDLDLELRALQWLYGTWLPQSRHVPDDQPGIEAFVGRPFAHGDSWFELAAQLPVRPIR